MIVQRQRPVGAVPHLENRVGFVDCWSQVRNEDPDSAMPLVFRYGNTRWDGNHALCGFLLNGCLYMCGALVWVFR
jgi:hypothetical protein